MSCFSARNAGPISKTLSNPPRTASCLYSWGLCERYASVSKYFMGNRLVPPSAAAAMIFGELISWNPSVIRWSLPYWRTLLLSWNIALTCSLLRSRCLLSSRTSRPTLTSSVTPTGSGVSASANIAPEPTLTSNSAGGSGSPSATLGGRFFATTPVTWIVDSLVADWIASNSPSSMLSLLRNAWIRPVPSRSMRKHIAPLPLTVSA